MYRIVWLIVPDIQKFQTFNVTEAIPAILCRSAHSGCGDIDDLPMQLRIYVIVKIINKPAKQMLAYFFVDRLRNSIAELGIIVLNAQDYYNQGISVNLLLPYLSNIVLLNRPAKG